jgi:hypothetical protein
MTVCPDGTLWFLGFFKRHLDEALVWRLLSVPCPRTGGSSRARWGLWGVRRISSKDMLFFYTRDTGTKPDTCGTVSGSEYRYCTQQGTSCVVENYWQAVPDMTAIPAIPATGRAARLRSTPTKPPRLFNFHPKHSNHAMAAAHTGHGKVPPDSTV